MPKGGRYERSIWKVYISNMDTAYAKGISLLWNSPIRYSTSFFRTWCFLVISVWFSFYFTTCKVEYSIFVWQAALGGYSKGSEKKTEIKLFFCLVIFPSLNYHLWVASVMWPFAVKTHLQPFPSPSTCLLLRSFLSWPSAFFFDGLAYWVEVEKHSDIVCYHLEKETIIYIYIPWKMEILSAWNKQHESWFIGFFRTCFFKASDGYLRNRGCLWWMRRGIGRHEELNKNRSCTCFEHYTCKSNFSPKVLQQLLLPTFHRLTYFKTSQSRVCFLSFTEAETVPPTGHPHPPTIFFRSRKHWGVNEGKLLHNPRK